MNMQALGQLNVEGTTKSQDQVHRVAASAQRALHERRQLGAFYTPERLSNILSDWAIRLPTDKVLEPSFGGCGFLMSANNTLRRLGSASPPRQIFGCDIDSTAFSYLRATFGDGSHLEGFLLKDYLDCGDERCWPSTFDAILANPPYISHHRVGIERVKELSKRTWPIASMSGRCSLWAYFIAHSLTMLRFGGRMAWVLPGAFLQADYAAPIRDFLASRFERVAAFVVRDRLFLSEGTDETTVVLLADGFLEVEKTGVIEFGGAETLEELEELIRRWDQTKWRGAEFGSSPAALRMDPEAISAFDNLSQHPSSRRFGDIARVQIGIVTGANDFFVLDQDRLTEAGLLRGDCERVLSKFRAAPGISLTEGDLDAYDQKGGRTFLINSDQPEQLNRVSVYLKRFSAHKISSNSTFRKRAVWSATSDGKMPDAFFPVMHDTGPRLVLNDLGCTSTNTIHRVFFKNLGDGASKLAAISILTSYSQISAELVGRRYGSGVLKHEPRDAEKIRIMLPDIGQDNLDRCISEIDKLLRNGDAAKACETADALVYGAAGLENWCQIGVSLRQAMHAIREKRRPPRKSRAPAVSPHVR